MKKVICLANHLFADASGARSLARAHVEALQEAFGKENITVFALVGKDKIEEHNNVFVKRIEEGLIARGINLLKGNTGKINSQIIEEIIETIKKEKAELLFFDDSIYGNAIRIIKKRYPNLKVAAFYHDIKRHLALEWVKKNPKSFPIQLSLINNEAQTVKYADVNIVLNDREKKRYVKYYDKEPEMQLPIILPYPAKSNLHEHSSKFTILFVGGYYYPNVNGFRWFVQNVAPLIKLDYEIVLVGNNMDRLQEEFASNDRVIVKGRVDDLAPYYEIANVVIGPIFEGAGMKVKTAEALSYGKIFVGTQESLEGYQEYAGDRMGKSIFLCHTAMQFAETINNLNSMVKFSKENYDFFIANYSIDAAVNKLRSL